MFEARLGARKFRKYVCTGRHITDEKIIAERDNVTTEEKVWTNEKATAEATVHIE